MTWSLFELMKRSMLRGPDSLAPRNKSRNQSIEELAVNVKTPSSPSPDGHADNRFSRRNRKGLVNPEHLISELIYMMDYLLRRNSIGRGFDSARTPCFRWLTVAYTESKA